MKGVVQHFPGLSELKTIQSSIRAQGWKRLGSTEAGIA